MPYETIPENHLTNKTVLQKKGTAIRTGVKITRSSNYMGIGDFKSREESRKAGRDFSSRHESQGVDNEERDYCSS